MIRWIAPISLRRGVEFDKRRVTISFERVKGFFRVAKWARGHGPRFSQSEVAIETKEITISYLGNDCGLWWIIDSHRRQILIFCLVIDTSIGQEYLGMAMLIFTLELGYIQKSGLN